MKTELIKQAIALYKNTLDSKSKFYRDDLRSFTERINNAGIEQIKQSINNMSYMQSEKSERDFDRETKRLDKAGMFDIGKMKHINALD